MFQLPKLPYAYDALEPYIDAKTMEIHYTKHHQAYVDSLNATVAKYPELQNKPVEELLVKWSSLSSEMQKPIARFAGGHWNHSMFWKLLKKDSGTKCSGALKEHIEKQYGSIERWQEEFDTCAKACFGSGWAWLVLTPEGELKTYHTHAQDCPIMEGYYPIMGLDVWEHSYYLNYQNRRPDYINAFWEVLDWNQVAENYKFVCEHRIANAK